MQEISIWNAALEEAFQQASLLQSPFENNKSKRFLQKLQEL